MFAARRTVEDHDDEQPESWGPSSRAISDEHAQRLFQDAFRDLAIVFERCWRSPGFTLVSTLTLALGIGAAIQARLTMDTTEWRREVPHRAQPSSGAAMSRNRRLIDTWYEQMWNRWDKTTIPKICAEEITFRGSLGATVLGHAGVAAYMDRIRQGFPDFTNVIEEVISEGDKSFARLTYVGTHQGTVLGFPPTGRRVTYSGAAVFTFRGDKIIDVWVLGDLQTLTRQLK